MSVFAGYSRYYDLLYRDKDYAAEARHVHDILQKHAPGVRSLVEIGCGTGAHAAELASLGYDVVGVDMSVGMLAAAAARKGELPAAHAERIEFSHGDARSVRLGRRFGAVVSLFHVMSYQTSNSDLAAAFATAAAHLEPGGVFVFDCWYGPAVLTDRPSTVVKKLADEAIDVTRVAEPEMHAEENVVDVNYAVTITDRVTGKVETLHETHRMRYLFTPEIAMMLEATGMALIESREWMTDRAPGFHSWSACFVAQRSQS
ncbi:MAG TPA: class I SAM-dependent methyltransferase [Gemmatimonadaceae bacterium]|nr:class I SAM-dependent methyltransferase [Gemmatimonadaceae bacterium]